MAFKRASRRGHRSRQSRRRVPTQGKSGRRYGNTSEEARTHVREALEKIGPTRRFTVRELRDRVQPGTASADIWRVVQTLARTGYLDLNEEGYRVTRLGWTWIEGAERSI